MRNILLIKFVLSILLSIVVINHNFKHPNKNKKEQLIILFLNMIYYNDLTCYNVQQTKQIDKPFTSFA